MGLNTHQVLEIRKKSGWNEILPSKLESRLSDIMHILLDPMGLMLLALGFIYLFLGQSSDAIIIFVSYIPVTGVDVLLEIKSQNALNALRASLNPFAKVIRDDKICQIPIRELVPGDEIIFEEGQNLPVDGIIIECGQLQINEAALTGESIPIDKNEKDQFWGGTEILQGRGVGFVQKIGKDTKFGKISIMLEETAFESSPLKKKIHILVNRFIFVSIFLAIVLFFVTYIKDHNWSQSLIESLTFGMAAIPEEFLLVYTLFLSLGAYRLSKHGVLVKSLPSVEALGGVDVICTDKTGTLTEGKFQFENLEPMKKEFSDNFLWQCTLMACEVKPVDAMETAIFTKGYEQYKNLLDDWSLLYDYSFDSKGKHMSHVWNNEKAKQSMIVMKGSVEGILEHCQLDQEYKDYINKQVNILASKGKRLLGLASKNGDFSGNRAEDENNLNFIALLVFSDPIRASAREAVLKCQSSGISVKMITGDHPLTAHAVADNLGLIHSHDYLYTGPDLNKMDKEERWRAYQQGAIFSRVLPEQKYEMVLALKSLNKVVAMTGDGINDAPALKAADIGISMGENATDVARRSAQMILMKNDFKGVIEAVIEGRKIFSNLKRSFSYLISFNIPIILFSFFPPLLGYGSFLLPIHVVLLELVIHPISAFSFENLPANDFSKDRKLMNMKQFLESLLSGFLLSLGSLYLYQIALKLDGVIIARTLAISTIILGNIFFVLVESWPKLTLRFLITSIGIVLFLLLILYVPPIAEMFYLKPISLKWLFKGFIVSALASIPNFALKRLQQTYGS